ncbi:MAG: hypothetical protein N3A65_05455 [candidate division WOR-3 bacterium]|nr:hypothetical protein [candidate division WOR-3 bacterium]
MAALFVSILNLILIGNHFVEEVKFEGNTFFSSDYLLSHYQPFKNQQDIENYIKKILDLYGDGGFPFCSIRPEFFFSDSNRKKLILHINEGERVIIKDYIFKTENGTDTGPLKRISGIKKDKYFSLSDVNRAKKTLLRTGVFLSVSEKILKKSGDYYLYFELKEKSTDYLVAGGIFGRDARYLSFEFSSLNIFKTLRLFSIGYESSIAGISKKSDLNLNFSDPVLLHPVIFSARMHLWASDSARLTELEAKLNTPVSDYLNISLTTGYEMVNYLTISSNQNYANTVIGLGLQSELITGSFSFSNSFGIDYLIRSDGRLKVFYDGSLNHAGFFTKPHYRLVKTERFGFFDYLRIGGSKNLRGYIEDEFLTTQAFWINIEYRKLPIYPFFDIAYFDSDIKYAYGAGIEARTTLANISLIFAFPEKGNWKDGKIHLLMERIL